MEMKTEDTPVRCDGMEEDGAPFSSPYRHYARVRWAPRNSHAHYPAARWGHRALPPLRTREVRTARALWYGAAALPRMRGTGRRALRGYWGRTETPPAKLSACATAITHAPFARALPGRREPGGPAAKHRALPPLHTCVPLCGPVAYTEGADLFPTNRLRRGECSCIISNRHRLMAVDPMNLSFPINVITK